jgi:hypothetical protein
MLVAPPPTPPAAAAAAENDRLLLMVAVAAAPLGDAALAVFLSKISESPENAVLADTERPPPNPPLFPLKIP